MLTQADIDLLNFEQTHPRHTGLKADAIRATLGLTAASYYLRLHRLVQQREVIEQYPEMAYRVQRRNKRRLEEREQLRQWLR